MSKVLHTQPARGLHDVEGSDDIGIEIGARVLQAVAHTGLCCEVDDDIRCKFILATDRSEPDLRAGPR